MPPLELMPMAAAIPALAIALIALGYTAQDGLLIIFALIALLVGGAGLLYFLI